jgi:hypothetical protein
MSLSRLKGLVVAVVAGGSTLVIGVSSAWATTTPPGAYLFPGNAPGGTSSVVVAWVAIAITAAVAAAYGIFALRAQPARGKLASVDRIGDDRRGSEEQRRRAA